MKDNIIEVLQFVEVYNLGTYDGIRIIGDNKIRTAKEHNIRVKQLRLKNPRRCNENQDVYTVSTIFA